jgi:hypothetical protein
VPLTNVGFSPQTSRARNRLAHLAQLCPALVLVAGTSLLSCDGDDRTTTGALAPDGSAGSAGSHADAGVDGDAGPGPQVLLGDEVDLGSQALGRAFDEQPLGVVEGLPGEALVLVRRDGVMMGHRVSASGALDPQGIPISGDWGSVEASVAFDGSRYLVVWGVDPLFVPAYGRGSLRAARLDAGGAPMDVGGFAIGAEGLAVSPSAVFDGESFVVAWQAARLEIARIQSDGTALPPQVLTQRGAESYLYPSLAWQGSGGVIAWLSENCSSTSCSRELRAARVSRDLELVDTSPILLGGSGYYPAAVALPGAPSGAFMIAWAEGGELFARKLGADGSLDPSTSSLGATGETLTNRAVVSSTADRVVMAWEAAGEVRTGVVDVAGAPTLTPSLVTIGQAGAPYLAPLGAADQCMVWRHPSGHVRTEVLHDGVASGGDLPVSRVAASHAGLVLAANESGYLAAWCERRPGTSAVKATRVDAEWRALDPEGVELASWPASERSCPSSLVAAGSADEFMVAWIEYDVVYSIRVGADGRPLDLAPVPLDYAGCDECFEPFYFESVRVLGDSEGYLVVPDGEVSTSNPYVHRVDRMGGRLFTAPRPHGSLAIGAPLLDGYLIVSANQGDITGARLGKDGVFVDEGRSIGACDDVTSIVVAHSTNRALVAWSCQTFDVGSVIHAALLDAENGAVVVPELVVSTEAAVAQDPAAVFDGTHFVIAWRDRVDDRTDVFGIRLTADGSSPDGGPTRVLTSDFEEGAPTLAAISGEIALGYTRYDPSLGSARSKLRAVHGVSEH